MALLIDCYNLLHATMPPRLAGLDEARLCRLLTRSPWAGQRIVVVCDGVAKPLGLRESPVPEVELIFSGRRRTADDVIADLIKADTAPRRLTVVSTDHAVQKAARHRRAKVLRSDQFVHLLATLPPTPGTHTPGRTPGSPGSPGSPAEPRLPAGKLGHLGPDEVQRWLRIFGVEDEEKP